MTQRAAMNISGTHGSSQSIKMKLFCNICLVRIGKNDIRGVLTSCQHILCHICYASAIGKNPKSCPKCKRREFSTMKIERGMPAHMMEYFLPPDAKLQQAIDAIQFQNKHMNWDGLLQLAHREEDFKLSKAKMAKVAALDEWNKMYIAKIEEYRQKLRISYRHLTALQANNVDLSTQRNALKESHILIRKTAKLFEVSPDPDEAMLETLFKKHMEIV